MLADFEIDVALRDLDETGRMIVLGESSLGDVRPDAIAVEHAADLARERTGTTSVGSGRICREVPRSIARW
jgi:hypothetical protein